MHGRHTVPGCSVKRHSRTLGTENFLVIDTPLRIQAIPAFPRCMKRSERSLLRRSGVEELEILDMLHDPPPSRLQDLRTVLLKEHEGRLGDGLV